jgi:hypothetical protein
MTELIHDSGSQPLVWVRNHGPETHEELLTAGDGFGRVSTGKHCLPIVVVGSFGWVALVLGTGWKTDLWHCRNSNFPQFF